MSAALDRAIAAMPERARASVEAAIADGAALLVLRPRKIGEIITGNAEWPTDLTLGDLLSRAREADTRWQRIRQASHWSYDFNLHVAVRQAARAIEILLIEGDRLPAARRA